MDTTENKVFRVADDAIRRDERLRLAQKLDESAVTIGDFVESPEGAVRLLALMLRMDATT